MSRVRSQASDPSPADTDSGTRSDADTAAFLERARRFLQKAGRAGFAARATVYLLLGVVSVLVALGVPGTEASDTGGFEIVASRSGGRVIMVVLFVGMSAYALWLLGQSFFGAVDEGEKAWPRVEKGFGGALYAIMAVGALKFALGNPSSQTRTTASYSAWAMQSTIGRVAVGAVGVGIAIAGGTMLREGVTRGFEKFFRMQDVPPRLRPVVGTLGAIGTVTRGIVFGLVGVFVLVAAIQHNPHKSDGLDYALRTLADTSAGPWLLIFVAAGLIIFAIFGYTEAMWRQTKPPSNSPLR